MKVLHLNITQMIQHILAFVPKKLGTQPVKKQVLTTAQNLFFYWFCATITCSTYKLFIGPRKQLSKV